MAPPTSDGVIIVTSYDRVGLPTSTCVRWTKRCKRPHDVLVQSLPLRTDYRTARPPTEASLTALQLQSDARFDSHPPPLLQAPKIVSFFGGTYILPRLTLDEKDVLALRDADDAWFYAHCAALKEVDELAAQRVNEAQRVEAQEAAQCR